MKWIGFGLAMLLFVGFTGFAVTASIAGWGLPGLLDKPISIRQGSKSGRRGGVFVYFGTRRHRGGGYGHGK